jgi:hypothetical protein
VIPPNPYWGLHFVIVLSLIRLLFFFVAERLRSDAVEAKIWGSIGWNQIHSLTLPNFWVLREPGSCSTCVTSIPNMQKLGLMNYKTSMTPILVQSSSEISCLVATRRKMKMSNFVETQKMGMQIPIRQIPKHDTWSQDTNTFSGI